MEDIIVFKMLKNKHFWNIVSICGILAIVYIFFTGSMTLSDKINSIIALLSLIAFLIVIYQQKRSEDDRINDLKLFELNRQKDIYYSNKPHLEIGYTQTCNTRSDDLIQNVTHALRNDGRGSIHCLKTYCFDINDNFLSGTSFRVLKDEKEEIDKIINDEKNKYSNFNFRKAMNKQQSNVNIYVGEMFVTNIVIPKNVPIKMYEKFGKQHECIELYYVYTDLSRFTTNIYSVVYTIKDNCIVGCYEINNYVYFNNEVEGKIVNSKHNKIIENYSEFISGNSEIDELS
ncbi:hypothetical protein OKW22_001152 [Bacilli bacterium PM5-3]|nr:hypothetical protein [Bacilli bacterium PM5-3]